MAQQENAELKTRVAIFRIRSKEYSQTKDKRIAELLQQFEIASGDRDAAVIEKQKANDAATLCEAQADRAEKAYEDLRSELAATQVDRNRLGRSYSDALSKYTESQNE